MSDRKRVAADTAGGDAGRDYGRSPDVAAGRAVRPPVTLTIEDPRPGERELTGDHRLVFRRDNSATEIALTDGELFTAASVILRRLQDRLTELGDGLWNVAVGAEKAGL